MKTVYRIEANGETVVGYPTINAAMQLPPRHSEAVIATSLEGVVLAEARPVRGEGTMLRWQLTCAGQDVADYTGWTADAPTLSPEEYDTALALALGEELERAS